MNKRLNNFKMLEIYKDNRNNEIIETIKNPTQFMMKNAINTSDTVGVFRNNLLIKIFDKGVLIFSRY